MRAEVRAAGAAELVRLGYNWEYRVGARALPCDAVIRDRLNAEGGVVAVVAHDAGGAEIVSSVVRSSGAKCVFSVEGPARRIFALKLPNRHTVDLAEAIAQSDWVLCGTSWQSDLELEAIRLARHAGKPVAAVLDHWVNYRERFTRAEAISLPDEIWVGDEHAASLARATFGLTPVVLVENTHLAEVIAEIHAATSASARRGATRVLYVCEPISEHAALRFGNARHWGYTEQEALRFFLSSLDALDGPVERVVVRPHPSEAPAKYVWAVGESPVRLVMRGDVSLVQQIADSDLVVGCNSMAMVLGLLAGRRVISCIPPGGIGYALPHPEIESLQHLVNGRNGGGAP